MYFTVIPFFLVANVTLPAHLNEAQQISIDSSSALYTYRGRIELSVTCSTATARLTVEGTLKCRNKNDAQLICRITDTSVESPLVLAKEFIKMRIESLKDPFQLNFDENGVRSLTVASTLTLEASTDLKFLASLFHVGVNFEDHELQPEFEAKENNTFGFCNTKFSVVRHPLASNFTEKNYSLRAISFPRDNGFDAIGIHKVTNPVECGRIAEYFEKVNVDDRHVTMTPLDSNMEITNTGIFRSNKTIESVFIRETDVKTMRYSILTIGSIELESIEITEDDLPTLPPSRTINLIFPRFSNDEESSSTSGNII